MSGGIDIVCCSVPEARSLLDSGTIRCLGLMAEKRLSMPGLEGYPTLKEQGSDWTLAGWRGLGVPRGTPPEIRERLVSALRRIVTGEVKYNGQTFPEYMDGEGFDRTWRATDDFAAFLAAGLGACCLAVIGLTRLRSGSAQNAEMSSDSAATAVRMSAREWVAVLAVPVAVTAYALLAEQTAFIPIAAAILLTFSLLLRSPVTVAVPLAVVGSLAIYLMFTWLLRVPLPPGWFG